MGVGLLQGSLLSPILFNVFIDNLPKLHRRGHPGLIFAGKKINALLYADDIIPIASSALQLQMMLGTCEKHSLEGGYAFSPTKCDKEWDNSATGW